MARRFLARVGMYVLTWKGVDTHVWAANSAFWKVLLGAFSGLLPAGSRELNTTVQQSRLAGSIYGGRPVHMLDLGFVSSS